MQTGDAVTIDFRKYPDTPHWRFSMYVLGEDRHGTWLWSPRGAEARRGDEPPVRWDGLHVKVITENQWWTAIWNDGSRKVRCYVDIATPAEWHGDTVRMIDLDLDIGLYTDGSVRVLDEDEFDEHRASLGYPERMVDQARTTTARIYWDVVERREPFGGVADAWLEKAASLKQPST